MVPCAEGFQAELAQCGLVCQGGEFAAVSPPVFSHQWVRLLESSLGPFIVRRHVLHSLLGDRGPDFNSSNLLHPKSQHTSEEPGNPACAVVLWGSNRSRSPWVSPKILPGAVTKPRNIPGSRKDWAVPVVTHRPASQQYLSRAAGTGAGVRGPSSIFPPSPSCYFSCWSLRGADKHPAGAVCKYLLPSALNPPPLPGLGLPRCPPPDLAPFPPGPPGQAPHTRILVACLRPDPSC